MNREERIAAVSYGALLDAWLQGNREHWMRRALELEAARPYPGEFTGKATPAELSARWQRLTEAAAACRARATLTDVTEAEFIGTLTDAGAAA